MKKNTSCFPYKEKCQFFSAPLFQDKPKSDRRRSLEKQSAVAFLCFGRRARRIRRGKEPHSQPRKRNEPGSLLPAAAVLRGAGLGFPRFDRREAVPRADLDPLARRANDRRSFSLVQSEGAAHSARHREARETAKAERTGGHFSPLPPPFCAARALAFHASIAARRSRARTSLPSPVGRSIGGLFLCFGRRARHIRRGTEPHGKPRKRKG